MNDKVLLGLSKKSVPDKLAMGETANTEITDHAAQLPKAAAVVAAMYAARATLQTAANGVAAAKAALKIATDAQVTAETDFDAKMTDVGSKVDDDAQGDPAIIHLSGLHTRNKPAPVTLNKPEHFHVTTGDAEGQLDWGCDTNHGGFHHLEVQVSPDPMTGSSFALKATSTETQGSIPGLPSATKQWVRVRFIGGKNAASPWSDPISRVVP